MADDLPVMPDFRPSRPRPISVGKPWCPNPFRDTILLLHEFLDGPAGEDVLMDV